MQKTSTYTHTSCNNNSEHWDWRRTAQKRVTYIKLFIKELFLALIWFFFSCAVFSLFFKKKKERKKIIIVSCVDFNFYFLYVNARKKKKQEAKKKVKVTECFYALQGVKCANTVKQNKISVSPYVQWITTEY